MQFVKRLEAQEVKFQLGSAHQHTKSTLPASRCYGNQLTPHFTLSSIHNESARLPQCSLLVETRLIVLNEDLGFM